MPVDEQIIRQIIRDELANFLKIDRYLFDQNIQILDSRHIQVGITNGTIIATKSTQKLGFFGATPVTQQANVSGPSGGAVQDTQARNAVNGALLILQRMGFMSP